MYDKLVLSLVLFSLHINNIFTSANSTECFFDRNEKLVEEFGGLTVQNCTIITDTNSTSGSDDGCDIPCDREYHLESKGEKFELSIGVGRNIDKEIIVLNVTISNVTFRKLSIRHQALTKIKENSIYWQTIEFKEDHIPQKLSVFSSVWECHRTKLQFFAEGRDYKFFKEYHFIPNSALDGAKDNKIFAYVDTTFRNKVYLHVQPYTNITRYIGHFKLVKENQETYIPPTLNLSADDLPYEQTNFPEDGNYRFYLVPVDNNGKNYTTVSVASFCMQSNCATLLIMIVGLGAIPVVMFFALCLLYIWIKKKILKCLKERIPNCLLVYSRTHDDHIEVVIKLAEYLKECGINAMIDVLHVPSEIHQNPTHWCDSAFQRANTVVVVASPKCKNATITKNIYQLLDDHVMKLIHEDRPHTNKKYFALLPSYCTESDFPKEAKSFTILKLPEDLKKLVNKIHGVKYTEVSNIPNRRELTECIGSARRNILFEEPISEPKSLEKVTDLIFSSIDKTTHDIDENQEAAEDNIAFICHKIKADETEYATNIRDLDLLKNGEA